MQYYYRYLVRITARNLCKVFDRCTIMDIICTVTSHIPVRTILDICRFTVDVTEILPFIQ